MCPLTFSSSGACDLILSFPCFLIWRSAATLLFGLFAFFDNTRHPLQFVLALMMMASVMAFKFAELQKSAVLSAWQSPAVPAVYLALTLLGAGLNLLEWWRGPTPQRRNVK